MSLHQQLSVLNKERQTRQCPMVWLDLLYYFRGWNVRGQCCCIVHIHDSQALLKARVIGWRNESAFRPHPILGVRRPPSMETFTAAAKPWDVGGDLKETQLRHSQQRVMYFTIQLRTGGSVHTCSKTCLSPESSERYQQETSFFFTYCFAHHFQNLPRAKRHQHVNVSMKNLHCQS